MQIITIFPREIEETDESSGQSIAQSAQAQLVINVLISEDRPISHPLAIRAKRLLSRTRKDDRGILIPEYEFISPLKVSEKALPRALRLLDALLFALERSNICVQWRDGKGERLGVVILNQRMNFSISEATARTRIKDEEGRFVATARVGIRTHRTTAAVR
jgi:hypothetical protein